MSTVRRVQRIPTEWPVVHLEADVPQWDGLAVDGLVRHPRHFNLESLQALGADERHVPLHCVWGWSRPAEVWEGIGLDAVLDVAEAHGDWVTITSASDVYSSCLPLADAAAGLLAWSRDGEDLTPETGGPLRFLGPPEYWAYKGVKWAARVTVIDEFLPGFWESRVADPIGRIPEEVVLP